ncbi:MAG: helix-turn-helix domain-containing protein [Phycisphaerales bacterium]|nr:MAG: helix-turn-helix domain-containing protein [Phycisphaerales bacterium]
MIPKNMPDPLSGFELFSLLSAAILHDVGMAVSKSSAERTQDIRVDHFNRSRELIIKNQEELGLSEHEARIIGEICRAHGMPNLSYLEGQVFSVHRYGEVRVPLLSACLRLADALDISSDRAPRTVANNRRMSAESRRHWDIHRCISDVQITTAPSWDIRIIAFSQKGVPEQLLYERRNTIQRELDTIYPVFRSAGVFFKKIELVLNRDWSESQQSRVKNPFLLLKPFGSRNARLFAGRDEEIQQMVERVTGRKLVVLIGESGVGKTSLVEAGVLPKLRSYRYTAVRFSFQHDPVDSLMAKLKGSSEKKRGAMPLVDVVRTYIDRRGRNTKLLLIGDHLEQMFTIHKSQRTRQKFVEQFSRVLGSPLPATFLFCIREDYLPDLFNLSLDIPALYHRDNTYRLHKLSTKSGSEVLKRASLHASVRLSANLIDKVADDLCYEGDGMIYPPYLQIVGYRLYAAFAKNHKMPSSLAVIPESVYTRLGGVETIVNRYLEGLLDQYPNDDKALIGQILSTMVTEYYTKKRVKKKDLQEALPHCHNLDRLLSSLVEHRIVRRSLGEYELIHDFLARRVIEFIEKKRFLSPPVRRAMDFIEKNHGTKGLTSDAIASAAGVTRMHLASLFKKQLGSSINRQLNQMRLAKAKTLLKSRDPLTNIVKETGFRTLSTFSRKFKQIEGISALEYRKTLIDKKAHGRK